MSELRLDKVIDVGVNRYVLKVTPGYELMFGLIWGLHRDNTTIRMHDMFGDETSSTQIFGVKDPISSFRAIIKEFVSYIFEDQPPFVKFSASEPSRMKLYERVVRQLERETGYEGVYNSDGYYLLVRGRL